MKTLRLPFVLIMWNVFVMTGSAQDMPLSQILPDDTTWRRSEGLPPNAATLKVGDKEAAFVAPLSGGQSFYVTVPGEKAVFLLTGKEAPRRFEVPLAEPTGVVVWQGGGTLVVADAAGQHLWAFRIAKDGSLVDGDRYYPLRSRPTTARSDAAAMTVDPLNRLYVATSEGVKVFDPTGRLCGALLKPDSAPLRGLSIVDSTLYVECGGKWYQRPLKPDGLTPPKPKR